MLQPLTQREKKTMIEIVEVIEVFETDGPAHRDPRNGFEVTVRTVAGFHHRFRVQSDVRVATLIGRAVDYFADRSELQPGNYRLIENTATGQTRDLVGSATLGDSAVGQDAHLILMSTDPKVDG